MPEIVCPGCSQVVSFVAIRRSSDEFCPKCDYPLFWAPTAVPMATPGSTNLATLRRLQGAGGRQRVGTRVCPECGEHNPIAETHCIRCVAELDPKPVVPEPEPEPVVQLLVPPPPPAPPGRPWWVIPAIALASVAAAVALIVLVAWLT